MPENPVLTYYNTMELLVAEEVRRQLNTCPANLKQYVNPIEVATYALNRLPPLYASSQEGLKRQKQKAVKELGAQIRTAVRQGFAAIQRDPLRQSIPLTQQDSQLQNAQNAAASCLKNQFYQSDSLRYNLKKLLIEAANKRITRNEIVELLSQLDEVRESPAVSRQGLSDHGWDDSCYQR